jgi:hypothetical protein
MTRVAVRDALVASVLVAIVATLALAVFTILMVDSVLDYIHHIRQC